MPLPTTTSTAPSAPTLTPTFMIVLAWLVVTIPAAWGIYNTGLNAKKLFAPVPPAAAAVSVHR